MQEVKPTEELNEKAIELILNFKPNDKYDKVAANEILKLKGEIKKAISLLPKEKLEIVDLRYFRNLTTEKISQLVGKSREKVSEILLSSIEDIKTLIKKGMSEPEQVEKVQSTNFKSSSKTQTNAPVSIKSKKPPLIIAGFVNLLILFLFFGGIYFIGQKFLFSKMPTLIQFFESSNEFVQEKILENKTLEKFIPIKVNNKSSKARNLNTIKISGSTSLLMLSRRWENTFSIEYPNYQISLIPSDSDKGINDLIKGKINIANSSRPITFLEKNKAAELGIELAEYRVALDALVIIVNKKNPIDEISLDDLESIFNGEVKNWQALSNFVKPILPVVREKGSGTNDFAITRILEGDDFPANILRKNSNLEIIKLVSENEGAIGFVNSTNYPWDNSGIKYLKIKNYDNSLSVPPFEGQKLNEKAIRYGDYSLAHYLYLITSTSAPKSIQDFIDWILSPKGQEIVSYSGLIPVFTKE